MKKNEQISRREYLENLLENFKKSQLALSEKISRQKELLSRKSAKKWSPEKRKKALSRINASNQEFNQTTEIVSQIEMQLSQL